MTLTRERTASGTIHTQWVDCPFCDNSIGEHESFRQHWQSCSYNTEEHA